MRLEQSRSLDLGRHEHAAFAALLVVAGKDGICDFLCLPGPAECDTSAAEARSCEPGAMDGGLLL